MKLSEWKNSLILMAGLSFFGVITGLVGCNKTLSPTSIDTGNQTAPTVHVQANLLPGAIPCPPGINDPCGCIPPSTPLSCPDTPTPVLTPVATNTPTIPPTPFTPTATFTYTISLTATPSFTPSPTETPTPTGSPTICPTAQQTPCAACIETFEKESSKLILQSKGESKLIKPACSLACIELAETGPGYALCVNRCIAGLEILDKANEARELKNATDELFGCQEEFNCNCQ